jgi:hypothetical protein
MRGDDYVRWVMDALDQLSADSEHGGRVMALPIHPFVTSQPSRHRYLAEALEAISARDDVWVTTSDEIARHYLSL